MTLAVKGSRCNSKDKTASTGSKTNTDLIEYFPKTLVKKEVIKKTKHIDTVVNSIQPLPLPITNTISNKHNNKGPQVDCFATNLSTSSRAYQDVVFDEISYSCDRTTSYPMD